MLTGKQKLMAVGAAVGAAGAVAATQATGAAFGFDPFLGGFPLPLPNPPFKSIAVYWPHAVYGWAWSAEHWPQALKLGLLATSACIGAAIVGSALLVRDAIRGKLDLSQTTKFGSEAWGTREDAVKAGLIAGEGPAMRHAESPFTRVLGEAFGETLTVTDDRFIGIFMGTGGGKSRLLSRMLFSWKSSAFIYMAGATRDIWEWTSGYRATFSRVILLDLGNPDGFRYNPLDEVRINTDFEWDDCRVIANRFPVQTAQQAKVPYWITAPTRIAAALIQYTINMAPEGEKTLQTVRKLSMMPVPALAKLLKACPKDSVQEIATLIQSRDKEKVAEVLTAVQDFLSPWDSPAVCRVTSRSDFSMCDLMAGTGEDKRPVSLYIRVPDNMSKQWSVVVKVLFGQARKALMHHEDTMPDGRKKLHDLAFIMDEYSSVSDDEVPGDASRMRKYGGFFIMATQSPKTLKDFHGPNQTLTDLLSIQIYSASADGDVQKQISDLLSEATEIRESKSTSTHGNFLKHKPRTHTTTRTEQIRKVLNSGEVRSFDLSEMIILPLGHKAFRVKKMMDFTEREPYLSMILPAAPIAPVKEENVKCLLT